MINLKWQLLLIPLLLQNVIAVRDFRVLITNIECRTYDPEYVSNATCTVVERNGKSYVNGILTFIKSMNNFNIHVIVDIYIGKRPKLTMVDLTLDGCFLLGNTFKNKLLQSQNKNFNKYINAPLKCPLKGNFSYLITNYTSDADMLPTYTPAAQFRYSLTILRLGKTSLKLATRGKIIHDAISKINRSKNSKTPYKLD